MKESAVAVIEQYIFEGWEKGLTGSELIKYVCYMSSQPSFYVEEVLDSLAKKMTDL
jgi:hypothetical protein